MKLKETIELMNSDNYTNRFVGEYYQTKIRYDRLHKMIIKFKANKLEFTPSCSIELLEKQAKAMGEYLYCLEIRAEIEGINLEWQR